MPWATTEGGGGQPPRHPEWDSCSGCARPDPVRAFGSIDPVLVLPILAVMGAVWIRRRAAVRQQRHAEEERLRLQAEEAEREHRIIAEMEADFQRP